MNKKGTELNWIEWYEKYTGKPIPQSLKNIGELVERTEGKKLVMTRRGWRWIKNGKSKNRLVD